MTGESKERLQLAAGAAARLATQCLAHAQRVSGKMSDRLAAAASSSPYGIDEARALSGEHVLAFKQLIEHIEAMCNAMVSHSRD